MLFDITMFYICLTMIGLITILISFIIIVTYLEQKKYKNIIYGLLILLIGIGLFGLSIYLPAEKAKAYNAEREVIKEKMNFRAEINNFVVDADNCITINGKMYCDILTRNYSTDTETVPVENYWKKGE